jgi:hypothetical protein
MHQRGFKRVMEIADNIETNLGHENRLTANRASASGAYGLALAPTPANVSFRQAWVSPSESRFLLDQDATDRGSADFELAGDLRFAAALLVQPSGFEGFVNHRWRAAEAFALLPSMS